MRPSLYRYSHRQWRFVAFDLYKYVAAAPPEALPFLRKSEANTSGPCSSPLSPFWGNLGLRDRHNDDADRSSFRWSKNTLHGPHDDVLGRTPGLRLVE